MEKSVDFYTKTLGLKLRSKGEVWSEVGGEKNGVYIGLHHTNSTDVPSKIGAEVSFKVNNIKEVQEVLQTKGVTFIREANEIAPNVWVANFNDPDGNAISIYE